MTAAGGASVDKARILIVDDEEDLRDVLAYQLRSLDAEIVMAASGRAALEAVKNSNFDAILSDISMPEMNGLEFLAQLRALGFETPFVFLTGFGDKAKAVEALRLGAFDFLEKPWEPEQLRNTMSKAIALGSQLHGFENDLERLLEGFGNLTEEQRQKVRSVQKALLVMKVHRNLINERSKKQA